MRIFYPYNEILPKNSAHDVYVFNNCVCLSEQGFNVELLCGKGSRNQEELDEHYGLPSPSNLKVCYLPILRKNNIFSLSWGKVFLFFTQREIQKKRPDIVIVSVLKQGEYHFQRKVKGVRYVYEAHQLSWYPYLPLKGKHKEVCLEKKVLEQADLVTVTTEAMKNILLAPPYQLSVPVEVVPLAVKVQALASSEKRRKSSFLKIAYVGQLYEGQGISLLIRALAQSSGVFLEIIGGKKEEIEVFKREARALGVEQRVNFQGFCPPALLPSRLEGVQAFVAPFEAVERMPYVAHTKLLEYACWKKPLILPNYPVVHEHFLDKRGLLFFEGGSVASLADRLMYLSDTKNLALVHQEMIDTERDFSWEARTKKYGKKLRQLVS